MPEISCIGCSSATGLAPGLGRRSSGLPRGLPGLTRQLRDVVHPTLSRGLRKASPAAAGGAGEAPIGAGRWRHGQRRAQRAQAHWHTPSPHLNCAANARP